MVDARCVGGMGGAATRGTRHNLRHAGRACRTVNTVHVVAAYPTVRHIVVMTNVYFTRDRQGCESRTAACWPFVLDTAGASVQVHEVM